MGRRTTGTCRSGQQKRSRGRTPIDSATNGIPKRRELLSFVKQERNRTFKHGAGIGFSDRLDTRVVQAERCCRSTLCGLGFAYTLRPLQRDCGKFLQQRIKLIVNDAELMAWFR